MLAPRGVEVRVRGLQSAGKPVHRVGPGQRSAISLSGLDLARLRTAGAALASPQAFGRREAKYTLGHLSGVL